MSRLNRIGVSFAAGNAGGLATVLSLWLFGTIGISGALGVALAPPLSPGLIYNMMVWGGIFGFLFLLPMLPGSVVKRGLLYGLAPSAVQCLIVFPMKAGAGVGGVDLGLMTPILVLVLNSIWGVVTAWLFVQAKGEAG